MQWLQDTSLRDVGILNNVGSEVRRYSRNNKEEYFKVKIEEIETISKIKSIRGLYRGENDFVKGYQPGNNIVNVEKSSLVTDCHSIFTRWWNHFSQLLNIHGFNDLRQTETTAEPKVPEPSASEVRYLLKDEKVVNLLTWMKSQ